MTVCVSCGKHIWGDVISLPGYGDYHYRCAELTGLLSLVVLDDETIKKKLAIIENRYSALRKLGREATDEEWLELDRIVKETGEQAKLAWLVRNNRQKALKKKGV